MATGYIDTEGYRLQTALKGFQVLSWLALSIMMVFLLANTLLRSVRPSQGPKKKRKRKLRPSSATPLPLSIRSPPSAWQLSPLTYLLSKYGRSLVAEFEGKKAKV
jgi:hypothetical protein